MYVSTKLHFEDLENRYGNPITILNLIKVKLSFQLLLDPIFLDFLIYRSGMVFTSDLVSYRIIEIPFSRFLTSY